MTLIDFMPVILVIVLAFTWNALNQINTNFIFKNFLVLHLKAEGFHPNKDSLLTYLQMDFEKLKDLFFEKERLKATVKNLRPFLERVIQEYFDSIESDKHIQELQKTALEIIEKGNIYHQVDKNISPCEDFKNFAIKFLNSIKIPRDKKLLTLYLKEEYDRIELLYIFSSKQAPPDENEKITKDIIKRYCASPPV